MAAELQKSRKKESPSPAVKDELENDPRFLQRIEKARANIRAGRGVRLEDMESE